MTTREGRARRAERLREWADKRDAKASAAREQTERVASAIPFGQPILVGHHSERRHRRDIDRIERGMSATIENTGKADDFRSRADTIDAQADRAIYDDDPDAVERLREKIAALEARRGAITAYNASCRKAAKTGGVGDASLLAEADRAELASHARIGWLRAGGALAAYATTNVTANIGRLRKRLAALEVGASPAQRERVIMARYGGSCADCGAVIERGQQIRYSRAGGARCVQCKEG